MITEIEIIENLFKKSKIKTISMQRIKVLNRRTYVRREPFKMYSGLTGALSTATFSGNNEKRRLDSWRDKSIANLGGKDNHNAHLQSMADFGTLTHECILRAWIDGKLDWKYELEYAENFFIESAKKNNIPVNMDVIRSQIYEYCKSAASLMQFLHEQVAELYAVESMCYSDELIIATPVDIVCKLKNGKIATINIKTSKSVSNHQLEQVVIEKHLWNSTYPDTQADITGVIRPKDWSEKKGLPTYELVFVKPEDEEKILKKTLARLHLCLLDEDSTYANLPTSVPMFTGVTEMGMPPKIEYKSVEEILNEREKLF